MCDKVTIQQGMVQTRSLMPAESTLMIILMIIFFYLTSVSKFCTVKEIKTDDDKLSHMYRWQWHLAEHSFLHLCVKLCISLFVYATSTTSMILNSQDGKVYEREQPLQVSSSQCSSYYFVSMQQVVDRVTQAPEHIIYTLSISFSPALKSRVVSTKINGRIHCIESSCKTQDACALQRYLCYFVHSCKSVQLKQETQWQKWTNSKCKEIINNSYNELMITMAT